LVLYTDGITEARNEQGEFFDEERLAAAARAHHLGRPAHELRDGILRAVHEFVGKRTQHDDMALTIVVRGQA
jgi:serine phosphatase RsbU (regulator of sigma subunit)